jgi:DNA-binding XRE family transcriptional regulator
MVNQLGELLRCQREGLGLSKREVAERAGVSHTAIARIESGRRRISLELSSRRVCLTEHRRVDHPQSLRHIAGLDKFVPPTALGNDAHEKSSDG